MKLIRVSRKLEFLKGKIIEELEREINFQVDARFSGVSEGAHDIGSTVNRIETCQMTWSD